MRSEKVVTATETVYTLTMNQEEYDYLRSLMGMQPATDGNGASKRIWTALDRPTTADAPSTASQMFSQGDLVMIAPDATWSNGDASKFTGPATVAYDGPDVDGDVRVYDEHGNYTYVLASDVTCR